MEKVKYDHSKNNLLEACGIKDKLKEIDIVSGKLSWAARRSALIGIVMGNPSLTSVLSGLTGLEFSEKSRLVEYLDGYLSDDDIKESIIRMGENNPGDLYEHLSRG